MWDSRRIMEGKNGTELTVRPAEFNVKKVTVNTDERHLNNSDQR